MGHAVYGMGASGFERASRNRARPLSFSMMWRLAAIAAVAGCWHEPAPVAPKCDRFGFRVLYGAPASTSEEPAERVFTAADEVATREFNAASAAAKADNNLGAASHFLACAKSYIETPEVEPWRAIARRNAAICYDNAITAFAQAGALESLGKPALLDAARDDKPLAPYIRKHLANPPGDCR
jgi:hypothetical protein